MLWSYGYGVYRVLVCFWDDVTSFIVPGCTVMAILYWWSGVRGIPWSRVRVRPRPRIKYNHNRTSWDLLVFTLACHLTLFLLQYICSLWHYMVLLVHGFCSFKQGKRLLACFSTEWWDMLLSSQWHAIVCSHITWYCRSGWSINIMAS